MRTISLFTVLLLTATSGAWAGETENSPNPGAPSAPGAPQEQGAAAPEAPAPAPDATPAPPPVQVPAAQVSTQ